jgi:signal transduction histidine kinase
MTIEVELGPDLPLIESDRAKVNQIVLDLMSNAIKFTRDSGTVVLRARACDGAHGSTSE